MSVNFVGEVSLLYFAGIFNMPQNITTRGRRLYFPSEGSRATNYRPRPGLNPRTFGPVASTITTRPPRPTSTHLSYVHSQPAIKWLQDITKSSKLRTRVWKCFRRKLQGVTLIHLHVSFSKTTQETFVKFGIGDLR
jgi:hypothetical protein